MPKKYREQEIGGVAGGGLAATPLPATLVYPLPPGHAFGKRLDGATTLRTNLTSPGMGYSTLLTTAVLE